MKSKLPAGASSDFPTMGISIASQLDNLSGAQFNNSMTRVRRVGLRKHDNVTAYDLPTSEDRWQESNPGEHVSWEAAHTGPVKAVSHTAEVYGYQLVSDPLPDYGDSDAGRDLTSNY